MFFYYVCALQKNSILYKHPNIKNEINRIISKKTSVLVLSQAKTKQKVRAYFLIRVFSKQKIRISVLFHGVSVASHLVSVLSHGVSLSSQLVSSLSHGVSASSHLVSVHSHGVSPLTASYSAYNTEGVFADHQGVAVVWWRAVWAEELVFGF